MAKNSFNFLFGAEQISVPSRPGSVGSVVSRLAQMPVLKHNSFHGSKAH